MIAPTTNTQTNKQFAVQSRTDGDHAKILIVDDELVNRLVLCRILSQRGFAVQQAENGREALHLLLSEDFDIVLLDLAMPELDGLQTARLVRQARNKIQLPVIIVTSNENREQVVEAFRCGANDYIKKPVDPEIVIARIESQLQLKRAQEALQESEERYALAAQGTNDGLWDWNLHAGTVFYSARWKAMLGLSDSVPLNAISDWFERIHTEDQARVQNDLTGHLRHETEHFETELRMLHEDNGYRWMLCRGLAVRNADGKAVRIAGSLTDITEGKVADALTSLPNRLLFVDRVQRCIDQSTRYPSRQFAVLYLDVDGFKLINDTYGHDVGDQFLIELARRLEIAVRKCESVVARLGGDEFAILVENLATQDDATAVARRVIDSLGAPFEVADRELFTRASIGITINSSRCQTSEDLIREADVAMYFAKDNVHIAYKIFEPQMIEETAARLELGSELRKAVSRNELSINYQPIVDITTGRTAGFEALSRWNNPRFGSVAPSQFIPLAEDTGIIIEIGKHVMQSACSTAAEMNSLSDTPLMMSVNISTRQIISDAFVETVQDAVKDSQLPAQCLKLEVTETTVMQDPEKSIQLLAALRDSGVAIGLDDFGTGYSSLAYLHRLPLSMLKIDRSFVAEMFKSSENLAIVETIVKLAESLKLEVIAEGVEDVDQLMHLKKLGCRFVQGFYFCRPAPKSEAVAMIHRKWSIPSAAD